MVEREPFDTLNSFQLGAGQPSPESFAQADGQACDEAFSGELPRPCNPFDDSFAMLYYPGESPYQAYPSYTDGTQFSPQGFHYSPEASSATIRHQPPQRVASNDQQPLPMSYSQSEGLSEPTQSTPASRTTNSHSLGAHAATKHRPIRPGRPKIARNPSSTQRGHAKQGSTSAGIVNLEDECDPPQTSSHTKERNRVAANKFRNRKRQVYAKLKVDEETLEVHHRQLQGSVKELTQEVFQLKMQLLKHSDCNCSLIQNYIQSEARRYIDETEQNPHPPQLVAVPPQTCFGGSELCINEPPDIFVEGCGKCLAHG